MEIPPEQALAEFFKRNLHPAKAARFSELLKTNPKKLLIKLSHNFHEAVLPEAIKPSARLQLASSPCYVFHASFKFGKAFASVQAACDDLKDDDSWLIITTDGSAGIYRPEDHHDGEIVIQK